MIDITIEDVINVAGEYHRKRQDEYEFQCPYCAAEGGDNHCDNLKFNARKHILHCFANPEHSKALFKEILKNKNSSFDVYSYEQNLFDTDKSNEITEEQKQEFLAYAIACNEYLLQSDTLLDFLYYKRGITKDTVADVFLGFDNNSEKWVIPTVEYNTTEKENEIAGFEYRPTDFSKNGISRSKGTPSTLAMINEYTENAECLAIVEGYFDGYALYQYLKEIGQVKSYHIVTCSNGVQSLLKQMAEINFTKYKQIYLFIDNDNVSRPVAAKIIEKYPFIQDITLNCGCKDFNEHYIKCIKKNNIKSMETLENYCKQSDRTVTADMKVWKVKEETAKKEEKMNETENKNSLNDVKFLGTVTSENDVIYNLNAKFKSHFVDVIVNKKHYKRLNKYIPVAGIKITKKLYDYIFQENEKTIIKKANRKKAQQKRRDKEKFIKYLENYIFTYKEYPDCIKKEDIETMYGSIDWQHFDDLLAKYTKS